MTFPPVYHFSAAWALFFGVQKAAIPKRSGRVRKPHNRVPAPYGPSHMASCCEVGSAFLTVLLASLMPLAPLARPLLMHKKKLPCSHPAFIYYT